MEVLYSTVKFKKRETRQTGDGETSKTVPEKEDVTYSTMKFSTQAAGQPRPDDSVDPSPEPGSKAMTTGQAKERLLWISLCALFFVVALVFGVLYIRCSISHKENTKEKEKIIQQLQTEKNNQTCDHQYQCVGGACCAAGWKYFSGKCYYVSTDKKTWTESRDACVAAGGHLVIINNKEEQDFLKRSVPGGDKKHYWVGLTDAVKEGDWRWLDGTRLSETPKPWTGAEPDNWNGEKQQYPEGEDCALICLDDSSYGLMDGFCVQEKKLKSVCEAKAVN